MYGDKMNRFLGLVLVTLIFAAPAYAQNAFPGGPQVPSGGGSGGGLSISGTPIDLVAIGPGTTAIQDSSVCSGYCALPNRFQVGSSTSAMSLWPDAVIPGTSTASQLYSITATPALSGYISGAFNTRTSDTPADTGGVTEGIQSLVLNDRTTGSRNAWGVYVQAMFTSTVAGSQLLGQEMSISNANAASSSLATSEDPFHVNNAGWDHGLRIDCIQASNFSLPTSVNCHSAIDVITNPLKFTTGINFGSGVLDTTVQTNPPALMMPAGTNGYSLEWFSAAATPEWLVYSDGSSGVKKSMELASSAWNLQSNSATFLKMDFSTGVGQMTVGNSASASCGNGVQFTGRATGQSVILASVGCTDTNINISVTPKGTGSLYVGTSAVVGETGSSTPFTLATGELGIVKGTASGTAPGAQGLKMAVVCGTNAGSLKIIAYGGTSTSPTTVTDNIGSGATGC